MISDDSHHASARTVCVVKVVPTADSRTHSYLPYPAVVDISRISKEIKLPSNSSQPQIVATQNEQRKK